MTTSTYTPSPVDTSTVSVPEELLGLVESFAKNTHENWSLARIKQGWVYGNVRDEVKKRHPDLVPYEELTDDEKWYDRNTAMETLKLTLVLGYDIVKRT